MITKINHIAIAVTDMQEAAKFYEDVMGITLAGVETIAAQKTKVGFFKIGESNIELVQPSEPGSPLSKFLEARGQGIHHICFEVDDVEAELKAFLEKGAAMIDQKPRQGAHGTKVAFVHPKSTGGVLIELCEVPKEGKL
jgi:methylmalonyl-CoA/ethylmalonyl-CoA epimerase